MDIDFWKQVWEEQDIGFHKGEPNPVLVAYLKDLGLEAGNRIFLPLCGKTLDIGWLLSIGYRVVGVEVSELAVKQLFQELKIEPTITESETFRHYVGTDIDIFVGDIFKLSSETLGSVDAIYDRAALVALPTEMRQIYCAHLVEITHTARQLLITFEYDQRLREGPPFSLDAVEINKHYHNNYHIALLESKAIPRKLKRPSISNENVWLLTKRSEA